MKTLTYHLKFRKELTFEQQKKFAAAVQWNILEEMRGQLEGYKKKAPQTVKTYIDSLLFEIDGKPYFYKYFVLGKEDDKTYVFGGPDPDELLGINGIVKRIPGLPALLPKSKVYEKFLHNVVTSHLGVENGGYKITVKS